MNTPTVAPVTIKINPETKEREEKREVFQQDAIYAWREYQETGLHVTGDEVIAWLDTWGDENKKPAPLSGQYANGCSRMMVATSQTFGNECQH